MKLTTNTILILFGILALMMLACVPLTLVTLPLITVKPAPTSDAVATLQSVISQTSVAMTSIAPTQTPLPPTPTVVPPNPTAIPPTNTPLPTSTPITHCDWVSFVKDVTIPDGTVVAPGETFVKTWRLKNRGTCAWTSDYMLVYYNGTQMGGTTAVPLPAYVAPGQTIDVSVTLTAPTTVGHYTGYWLLRNSTGVLFGYGDNANKAFYVDISTKEVLPHGEVDGTICYPSEFNPPLTLYFEKASTGETIQFYVPENHMSFRYLLPNGTYYAYAWAPGYNLEGAYVNPDGTMKTFVIKGGQTTSGIRICDWDIYSHSRGQ
jgi:hypothetical protein